MPEGEVKAMELAHVRIYDTRQATNIKEHLCGEELWEAPQHGDALHRIDVVAGSNFSSLLRLGHPPVQESDREDS
ncbi:hypothetical protein HMPREF1870_00199 [Bacteroidales bacterium KA00344]|nr:hypothetical protein HMPREF1870_00199 [Bacteroidales bacterium KA00344]